MLYCGHLITLESPFFSSAFVRIPSNPPIMWTPFMDDSIVLWYSAQVYVTLTCQEDLDNLIRLLNSTASNYSGFSVRLFSEPASISSADGMFIKTPSTESEPDPLLMVCFHANFCSMVYLERHWHYSLITFYCHYVDAILWDSWIVCSFSSQNLTRTLVGV